MSVNRSSKEKKEDEVKIQEKLMTLDMSKGGASLLGNANRIRELIKEAVETRARM